MRSLVLSRGISLIQRLVLRRTYLNWPSLKEVESNVTGVRTLVSEKGVEAAFKLNMERKCNGSGVLQPSSGSMV